MAQTWDWRFQGHNRHLEHVVQCALGVLKVAEGHGLGGLNELSCVAKMVEVHQDVLGAEVYYFSSKEH